MNLILENYQAIISLTLLSLIVVIFVFAFFYLIWGLIRKKIDIDDLTKLLGILLIGLLAILADYWLIYFVSFFIIGTVVTDTNYLTEIIKELKTQTHREEKIWQINLNQDVENFKAEVKSKI